MIERQLSQLLGERVEILEPISIREFEKGLYAPDFIVSTLPIMEPKAPVFIVSPILTEAQKQQLMKRLPRTFCKRTRMRACCLLCLM